VRERVGQGPGEVLGIVQPWHPLGAGECRRVGGAVARQAAVGYDGDVTRDGLDRGQSAGVLDDDIARADEVGHGVGPADWDGGTRGGELCVQFGVVPARDDRDDEPGGREVGRLERDVADSPRAGHHERELGLLGKAESRARDLFLARVAGRPERRPHDRTGDAHVGRAEQACLCGGHLVQGEVACHAVVNPQWMDGHVGEHRDDWGGQPSASEQGSEHLGGERVGRHDERGGADGPVQAPRGGAGDRRDDERAQQSASGQRGEQPGGRRSRARDR
jgi:hypothetical protein